MNIIQIGTNKADDYLSTVVKGHHPNQINNLILVEPFDYHNANISICYQAYSKQLHLENIIITPDDTHPKQAKIWYHELDSQHSNAYELASLNPSHAHNIRNNYNTNDMTYKLLDCYSINELFNKYNLLHIDILAIDTEGFDDQIIYSINFSKYTIDTILYEHLHIDRYRLHAFLQNRGYSIQHSLPEDPYTDKATKNNIL